MCGVGLPCVNVVCVWFVVGRGLAVCCWNSDGYVMVDFMRFDCVVVGVVLVVFGWE